MVRDINNDLDKRREMDTGEELRYLARCSANTRIKSPGFLEHAYRQYMQQNKNETHNSRFSQLLGTIYKNGEKDKP